VNTTKEIKDLLNNENFLKYIKLNHDIKAIYIGGSRMFDLNDEKSDYDINIVVDDMYYKSLFDNMNAPILYAKYNGINIHWYYISPDFKIHNQYSDYILDIWQLEQYYGLKNPDNIIKIYDEEYFNKFKQKLTDEYDDHLLKVKNKYSSFILSSCLIESNVDLYNSINKLHYFLCLLFYLLNNETIDVEFLKFIKKIAKFNRSSFSFEKLRELDNEKNNNVDKLRNIFSKLYRLLQKRKEV